MKVLVLYTLVLLAAKTQGSEGGQPEHQERPRVLCGRVLADARMLYCFSSTEAQKKSVESPLTASLYPYNSVEVTWPWLARRSHQQALTLGRAKRDPGLVDECCLKPCYVSELLNYC